MLRTKKYSLDKSAKGKSFRIYELNMVNGFSLKAIDFEERKPSDITALFTDKGELSISLGFFSDDEFEILKTIDTPFRVTIMFWEKGRSEDDGRTATREYAFYNPVCLSKHKIPTEDEG